MKLSLSNRTDEALTLVLERQEIPIFRALLDRAAFIDTRPEIQEAVIDFVHLLRERIDAAEGKRF